MLLNFEAGTYNTLGKVNVFNDKTFSSVSMKSPIGEPFFQIVEYRLSGPGLQFKAFI